MLIVPSILPQHLIFAAMQHQDGPDAAQYPEGVNPPPHPPPVRWNADLRQDPHGEDDHPGGQVVGHY